MATNIGFEQAVASLLWSDTFWRRVDALRGEAEMQGDVTLADLCEEASMLGRGSDAALEIASILAEEADNA